MRRNIDSIGFLLPLFHFVLPLKRTVLSNLVRQSRENLFVLFAELSMMFNSLDGNLSEKKKSIERRTVPPQVENQEQKQHAVPGTPDLPSTQEKEQSSSASTSRATNKRPSREKVKKVEEPAVAAANRPGPPAAERSSVSPKTVASAQTEQRSNVISPPPDMRELVNDITKSLDSPTGELHQPLSPGMNRLTYSRIFCGL